MTAPATPGAYKLRLTAVQEMMPWMDGEDERVADEHDVSVKLAPPT